ncbi:MAG TPA: exonuclease domain-containing protein [Candidatus Levybacteria bacterium]|nr:exonuclease domain-containing protein [Candidatus Levybacteria bacterium]
MILPKNLAFVDIETTGHSSQYDRIIEIGIVRVEDNKIVQKYNTLLNPDQHVSPFIENLTGISSRELENAPTFYEKKDEILQVLANCTFVAHNVRFDYGFLRSEFKRYLTPFSMKHFCTVKLSRALFPQYKHHNLDALIERFGFVCEDRHRALGDAQILWEFYRHVQQHLSEDIVKNAVFQALKRPSRPIHISEEVLDSLPESPGVYIFHSKDGTPLYIGKSVNIRERVLSHFANDTESTKERALSEQTHHIEAIVTAGELSALFLESQMIKEMQPLYNRKLRYRRKLFVLFKTTDAQGYDSVTYKEMEKITADDLPNIVAIVKSKKQAGTILRDLARIHGLCPKVLGIEHTVSSCFSYRLGWCKGACVGKEQPLTYNLRMTMAFSEYKVKKWPFDGPIQITEENALDEKSVSYVINSWCYLGSCEGDAHCELNTEYIFDHDMYKILVQFLKNPANYKKIRSLNLSLLNVQTSFS